MGTKKYSEILKEKIEYYGNVLSAYEFAGEEFERQQLEQFTPEELEAIKVDSIRALEMFHNSSLFGDKIRQSIINKINKK